MDIAYAIEGLVLAAKYQGSTNKNTEESYNSLVWQDERAKPTWSELTTYWNSDACKSKLAEARFDLVLFQTDLATALPTLSSPNLRWEFAALNTYAQNKDFEGMAGYMGMLIGAGAAIQSDSDAVIALLTKQGIVL